MQVVAGVGGGVQLGAEPAAFLAASQTKTAPFPEGNSAVPS
jgi:hypothetical protein